jgi:hypothetical protein
MRWLEELGLNLEKWGITVYNIIETDKIFRNYY